MTMTLALDIGATKLDAALVDAGGRILGRASRSTDQKGGAEALLERLLAAASEADPDRRARVCGVGCAGPMSPGGELVSPLNVPAWRAFPLRRRLVDAIGLPVAVEGDAKALALGEGWLGAAVGKANYLAMVVSTGVGGGIVLDGRLLDGRLGNAGHIGHVIVNPGGRECRCGGVGCLEAEVSGGAIAAFTGRPPAQAPLEVRQLCGRLTGRAIASVCNLLDLDLALVGGSVALGYSEDFFVAAQDELSRLSRLDYSSGAVVRPVALGADGPIIGAAAVGLQLADTTPVGT